MKLSLVSIEKEGLVRIAAEGRATYEDFPTSGRNPLETLLGTNWATNRVLLDMSDASYIDSSAIGWLISANKELKSKGGRLAVHSIPPNIKQIFDLLKIGKAVSLAEDEAAAKSLLSGER